MCLLKIIIEIHLEERWMFCKDVFYLVYLYAKKIDRQRKTTMQIHDLKRTKTERSRRRRRRQKKSIDI